MAVQDNGFPSTVTSVVTVTASPSTTASSSDRDPGHEPGQTTEFAGSTGDADRDVDPVSSDTGLSSRAEKIVLATTTVGGTLILILLFYALWRRRQGASCSEIVRFKPQAITSTIIQHPDNDHVTALPSLPIYRHRRVSIRSSRHPSLTNLRNAHRAAVVPSPLRSEVQSPVIKTDIRKSCHVPRTSPVHSRWQTFLDDPSPTTMREPEIAHVFAKAIPTLNLPTTRPSEETHHPLSPPLDGTLKLPSPLASPSPLLNPQDRWSWTNSQAPSTPRIEAPNTRSSLTSTSTYMRNVASWVRGHAADEKTNNKRGSNVSNASSSSSSRRTPNKSRPLLKNQASHPTLAPSRAPPSSSKSAGATPTGRVASLSMLFRSTSWKTRVPPETLAPEDRRRRRSRRRRHVHEAAHPMRHHHHHHHHHPPLVITTTTTTKEHLEMARES